MKTSPLDAAYNRLDEAHRAWHIALKGYHRVEDFRAGLNNAIQAFRNLTFVLQEKKHSLPEFDTWYAGWQIKMYKNPILKAFHKARTVIVHQDDLKLKSRGTAKIKDWVDFERWEFEFDPLKDSKSIAVDFYENYAKYLPVSDELSNKLIFEFERIWIYDKLPDHELLNALSESYNFFYDLLDDAQKVFKLPKKIHYKSGSYCDSEFNSGGLLKCMLITKKDCILKYNFGTRCEILASVVHIDTEEVTTEDISTRYGDMLSEENRKLIHDMFSSDFPYKDMEKTACASIQYLRIDGKVLPTVFIYSDEKKSPTITGLLFADQVSKIAAIEEITNKIVTEGGKHIFFVAEAWVQPNSDSTQDKIAIEQNKKESLIFFYMSSENGRHISIPFHRDESNNIIFEEATVKDFKVNEKHGYNFLRPFISALQKS